MVAFKSAHAASAFFRFAFSQLKTVHLLACALQRPTSGHSTLLERSPKLDVCSGIQMLRWVNANRCDMSEVLSGAG
jgi:hypothetical protein